MLACVNACDWGTQTTHALYSKTLNRLKFHFPTVREITSAGNDNGLGKLAGWQFPNLTPDSSCLADIPRQLWATGKHDPSPKKGVKPMVITHKPSFRLCKNQYLIKPEGERKYQTGF